LLLVLLIELRPGRRRVRRIDQERQQAEIVNGYAGREHDEKRGHLPPIIRKKITSSTRRRRQS
jgi:hypothetical protein